jgi:hypothetical protein
LGDGQPRTNQKPAGTRRANPLNPNSPAHVGVARRMTRASLSTVFKAGGAPQDQAFPRSSELACAGGAPQDPRKPRVFKGSTGRISGPAQALRNSVFKAYTGGAPGDTRWRHPGHTVAPSSGGTRWHEAFRNSVFRTWTPSSVQGGRLPRFLRLGARLCQDVPAAMHTSIPGQPCTGWPL